MPGFVLLVRPRGDGDPAMRLGLTVSKKVGNAVVRNRMKRRFRELAREMLPEAGIAGADHVLIGRAGGIERRFRRARRELRRALAKVGTMIARLLILVARGWQMGPSRCCRRAAATRPAVRPMQSPRFPAMARCAGAGWPPGACSAATPGGDPATTRCR